MKENNILVDKAMDFALRIINLYRYICYEKKSDFIISKQIFKSGTSIGANIAEATRGESEYDFVHKLKISRKEAQETMFWLELLYKAGYIDVKSCSSMKEDCEEILKILTSTIKTMEKKIEEKRNFKLKNNN